MEIFSKIEKVKAKHIQIRGQHKKQNINSCSKVSTPKFHIKSKRKKYN